MSSSARFFAFCGKPIGRAQRTHLRARAADHQEYPSEKTSDRIGYVRDEPRHAALHQHHADGFDAGAQLPVDRGDRRGAGRVEQREDEKADRAARGEKGGDRCDAITRELVASSAQLTELMASLNKAIPGMVHNANGVLANANALTGDLRTTTGNLNTITGNLKELPLDTTLNRINATLANVQRLTAKLNNENSSLGMLLNDKKLYQNATSTVASLDSLLQDVKKHPKKYVTIKVF